MNNINKEFQKFREKILSVCDKETRARIKTNPVPTEPEIYLGSFYESIEPQVRDAVIKLNNKGYPTESSGFYGNHGETQAIDGYFSVDKLSQDRLKTIDVNVLDKKDLKLPGLNSAFHSIRFNPPKADIDLIKQLWDKVAEILPDLKKPLSPSISNGSMFFRQMFAPERLDVEKLMLEKLLNLETQEPNFYRPAFEHRLKTIQKIK